MTKEEARAHNEQVQGAYHATFTSPQGRIVLADLVAYCHGRKSTFDPNERVHAFKEGQRDVLNRVNEFTNLSLEEIYELRGPAVRTIARQEDTDG
jgi:hypothetical protein